MKLILTLTTDDGVQVFHLHTTADRVCYHRFAPPVCDDAHIVSGFRFEPILERKELAALWKKNTTWKSGLSSKPAQRIATSE